MIKCAWLGATSVSRHVDDVVSSVSVTLFRVRVCTNCCAKRWQKGSIARGAVANGMERGAMATGGWMDGRLGGGN